MALKLIRSTGKNAVGGFIPNWYGVYRDGKTVRTISLGIQVRGKPPKSGRLASKGNREFEHSRREAQEELNRRIGDVKIRRSKLRAAEKEKGDAIRETAEIIERKTGRKFEDPKLYDLADKYLGRIGERSKWHMAMISSCFKRFSDFAHSPIETKAEPADTLMEVTDELTTAFFRHVAKSYSFSTVKRWSSILRGAFSHFAPVGMANPFEGARLAAVGRVITKTDEHGEKVRAETVIHHRPLDNDELHKVLAEARKDPMLYHLAITTAATGLRISDAAMLRFQDCNLVNGVVTLTTIKTGSKVGIPIFDYDPSSPNYEPELGEFRRHLETALAEAGDREEFVCPQAANLYKKIVRKSGKLTYPGRDAIYARGKALFARALFTDELKITEADFTQTKTPDEIRHEIAASKWSEEKKQRTTVIFSLYADGQSYNDIVKATRHPKSTISADLTAIETLTRSAIKRQSDYPSLRKLLPYTRKERAFGMRSASLYSWHSMRCTFVVRMLSNASTQ